MWNPFNIIVHDDWIADLSDLDGYYYISFTPYNEDTQSYDINSNVFKII